MTNRSLLLGIILNAGTDVDSIFLLYLKAGEDKRKHTCFTLNQIKIAVTGSYSSVWCFRLAHEVTEAASARIIRHWQYQHMIFFPPLLFFATLLCFYWSVRYSHFSFILLPAKCTSFLPFLLFFFSFSSSVLPVQIMVLANAIHRFNSIFMAHCKTTPHLIPFSLFLLWLGVKLEKILQCLPNANSWLESLSTILIHSENEENLRCWLDLS